MELGSHSKMNCLAANLFLNSRFSDNVRLCSAQLFKQQLAQYSSCLTRTGVVLNIVVLVVAGGLLGLDGS